MYGYDDKKIVRNPINEEYFAGGSSAGSAVAVKSQQSFAYFDVIKHLAP